METHLPHACFCPELDVDEYHIMSEEPSGDLPPLVDQDESETIRTQRAKDNPARMNAMTARAINAAASTLSSAPVTGDIDVAINQFIESFIVHDRGHVIGPDYNGHTGV